MQIDHETYLSKYVCINKGWVLVHFYPACNEWGDFSKNLLNSICFACFVHSVGIVLQIALKPDHGEEIHRRRTMTRMTRSRTRSRSRSNTETILFTRTVRETFNIQSAFFDMSEMSMLSSSGHPEMWTVESGSESILPLKEHRVAWKKIKVKVEIVTRIRCEPLFGEKEKES